MPEFVVEYSYDVPEYGSTVVTADNINDAESVALDQLSDSLETDITAICIESIKPKKD